MIRLFISFPIQKNIPLLLNDKQCHYLLHVMRCSPGDSILCFNGIHGEWKGELVLEKKKLLSFVPHEQTKKQLTPDFCAICPALIKKDHFDLILQKATELNVTDIYPLKTDRSVLSALNMERSNGILAEAAEQSERLTLPVLHPVMTISQLLNSLSKDIQVCYLSERGTNTGNINLVTKPAFIIGPEGGFSPNELDLLSKHTSSFSIHFTDTILRAETAAIVAIAGWQLGSLIPHKK